MAVEYVKHLVINTKKESIFMKSKLFDGLDNVIETKNFIEDNESFDEALRRFYSLFAMNYIQFSASCKTVSSFALTASLDYYEILTGEEFPEENHVDFCGDFERSFRHYVKTYVLGYNVLKQYYNPRFLEPRVDTALKNPLVKSFKEDYKKFFEVQSLIINEILDVFYMLNNKEYCKEFQGRIYQTYLFDTGKTVKISAWNTGGSKSEDWYIPSPIQEAYFSKKVITYDVGVCNSDTGVIMNNLEFLRKITGITPEEEKSYKTRYKFAKFQLEKARNKLMHDLEEERKLSCV